MPRVVVNELNIAVFELASLTGNSKEDLLQRAAEALSEGYELTCMVPDEVFGKYVSRTDEGGAYVNVFEHAASDNEVAPREDDVKYTAEQIDYRETVSRNRAPEFRVVDVVEGEIIEDNNE